MTNPIPEVQKPQSALMETLLTLEVQQIQREESKDTTADAKKGLAALETKGAGAAGNPLANVPPAKEQPDTDGNYYPIGMSAIYYLMMAAQADLRAGNEYVSTLNEVMKSEFASWAKNAKDQADSAKKATLAAAWGKLWEGVGSTAGAAASVGVVGGQMYSSYSSSSEIEGLQKLKQAKVGDRLNEVQMVTQPTPSDKSSIVAVRQDQPAVQPSENLIKDSKTEVPAVPSKPAVKPPPPKGLPSPETAARNKVLAKAPPAAPEDPISVQKTALLEEKSKLVKEKQGAIATGKGTQEIDEQLKDVDIRLDKLTIKDEKIKSEIDDLDDKIKRAQAKEESSATMWRNFANLAGSLGQVVGGFTGFKFQSESAEQQALQVMSETQKQFGQNLTQSNQSAADQTLQNIDREINALEQVMRGLYQAQAAGSA